MAAPRGFRGSASASPGYDSDTPTLSGQGGSSDGGEPSPETIGYEDVDISDPEMRRFRNSMFNRLERTNPAAADDFRPPPRHRPSRDDVARAEQADPFDERAVGGIRARRSASPPPRGEASRGFRRFLSDRGYAMLEEEEGLVRVRDLVQNGRSWEAGLSPPFDPYLITELGLALLIYNSSHGVHNEYLCHGSVTRLPFTISYKHPEEGGLGGLTSDQVSWALSAIRRAVQRRGYSGGGELCQVWVDAVYNHRLLTRDGSWITYGLEPYMRCHTVLVDQFSDHEVRGWMAMEHFCASLGKGITVSACGSSWTPDSVQGEGRTPGIIEESLKLFIREQFGPGSYVFCEEGRDDRQRVVNWAHGRMFSMGSAIGEVPPLPEGSGIQLPLRPLNDAPLADPRETMAALESSLGPSEYRDDVALGDTPSDHCPVSRVYFNVYTDSATGVVYKARGSRDSPCFVARGVVPVTASALRCDDARLIDKMMGMPYGYLGEELLEGLGIALREHYGSDFLHYVSGCTVSGSLRAAAEVCRVSDPDHSPERSVGMGQRGPEYSRELLRTEAVQRDVAAQSAVYAEGAGLVNRGSLGKVRDKVCDALSGRQTFTGYLVNPATIRGVLQHSLTEDRHLLALLRATQKPSVHPPNHLAARVVNTVRDLHGSYAVYRTPFATIGFAALGLVLLTTVLISLTRSADGVSRASFTVAGLSAFVSAVGVFHRTWYPGWAASEAFRGLRIVSGGLNLGTEEKLDLLALSWEAGKARSIFKPGGNCYLGEPEGDIEGLGPLTGDTLLTLGCSFSLSTTGQVVLRCPDSKLLYLWRNPYGGPLHAEGSAVDPPTLHPEYHGMIEKDVGGTPGARGRVVQRALEIEIAKKGPS